MSKHDPNHSFVRKLIGCGHGVLFDDYCKDCHIIWVMDQYKQAVKTIARCRDDMRRLGVPLPGQSS
jgi:hypothetical protein